MHIPDGYLCTPVCVATAGLSAMALGYSAIQSTRGQNKGDFAERALLTGAAIGLVQSLNFPVSAGASGHLIGSCAAAALLGPWAAIIVASAVVVAQAALLGDGGLGALGANLLNLVVIPAAIGWSAQRATLGIGGQRFLWRRFAIWFVAGVSGVLLAALACSCQLSIGHRIAFSDIATTMLSAHISIAAVEGLVTGAVAIWAVGGSTVVSPAARPWFRGRAVSLGLLLLLATLLPVASTLPDGFQTAAAHLGWQSPSNSGR